MKEIDPNKPIKRTLYQYDAQRAEYLAGIRRAMDNTSLPLAYLQTVYHLFKDYMHSGHLNPIHPAGQSNNTSASKCSTENGG